MDIRALLGEMVQRGASDLYLTVDSPPMLRIEGFTQPLGTDKLFPKEVEILANSLMSERQRAAFDDKLEMNLAIASERLGRFRVNLFRQRGAVSVVIRQIKMQIPTLDELQLPPILKTIALSRRGMVLVTGATGSGKSTTQAAMLDFRNETTHGHILTVEDPIEFVHSHKQCIVNQREVGFDTVSFNEALRNTLRQAPDVILIGEVRDLETMEAAITFAETGHLCLATLHSNNANQAIERVMNFFPVARHAEIFLQLSLNLRAIISQRLIPGLDGKRVAAMEILIDTPWAKDLIKRGEVDTLKEAMEKSTLEGGQTFDQALFTLYTEGLISEEQALANADSANNLRIKIKNFDISGKTTRQQRMAAALAGEDFRIEGVTPTPHLRRM
ncbi:MAG TPA: PilT/PilU family type 4a pilus ATPase [Candidatus Margulisiibacteriota bacterium]|nr:PilT/PilU family type 4a pilus ATPase [Candidatus Margulisiibacteriota bacterium]